MYSMSKMMRSPTELSERRWRGCAVGSDAASCDLGFRRRASFVTAWDGVGNESARVAANYRSVR